MNIELLLGTPPSNEECGCAICALGRIKTDNISEQIKNDRAREFGHTVLGACNSLSKLSQGDFVNCISIFEKMGYPVTASIIHAVQRLHIMLYDTAHAFHNENEAHKPVDSLVN